MRDLTTKNYWEGRKFKEEIVKRHPFEEIFKKHIKKGFGKRVLEIGCAPGSILGRQLAQP